VFEAIAKSIRRAEEVGVKEHHVMAIWRKLETLIHMKAAIQDAEEACVKAAKSDDIEALVTCVASATKTSINEDILANARARLQALREKARKEVEDDMRRAEKA